MIPSLKTKRLLLRPFAQSDAGLVQTLAGPMEVASTTLNIPHPYEDGLAEAWIETHEANWEARESLALAIEHADAGLMGAISIRLNLDHLRGEIGYWLGIPFWNQGFATEAAAAMVHFGFADLGLNRIEARFLGSNPASGRVIEKLGMKREGVLRDHIRKFGSVEDTVVYSILSGEYDVEKHQPK